VDLSYRELEVKDCGSVQFECLNFKLQKSKVRGNKNKQKVDNVLKMESHVRKFEVLLGTKMLPCAIICRAKFLKNLILGTSWPPSELQIHSIASTKKLFPPCSQKSTQTSEFFQ
jgi:hypothetical protein